MTKIILARHGVYYNPDNIVPFRSNAVTLSLEGVEQIEKNALKLLSENISQIYSSPIKRCADTAEIFSRILKIGIDFEDDLKEIDSPYQDIPEVEYKKGVAHNSIYADQYHLAHGGESIEVVDERLRRVLDKILKENKDQNVLVVGHGDPLMIMLLMARGVKFDINNKLETQVEYIPKGGLVELEFDGSNFVNFSNLNF